MTALSVTALADRKRRIAEFAATVELNPYRHEDAMDRLIGRDAPAISRAIGLQPTTINQWRQRHDGTHRGPNVTLSLAIRRAIEIGRPKDEALAVVDAILEENGEARCSRMAVEAPTVSCISEHAVTVGKEAAEACVAAVVSSRTGDKKEFRIQLQQALAALFELEQLVLGSEAAARAGR